MNEFLTTVALFKWVYIVGPLIGATCAALSVYVVLRRMAMLSEGVSHAGFGGIGLALFIGMAVSWADTSLGRELITGVFCLGTALLIGYFSHAKKVTEDSAIGIFLVATVALGMLLLSIRAHMPAPMQPGAAGQLRPTQVRNISVEQLLFGSFTAVDDTDALLAIVAAVIVLGIITVFYSEFLYVTLDEEMARINGVNVRLMNTLMLIMISLVIVVGVRMVGFLMITALTIIPGATATMISRRFGWVLLASILIGLFGALGSITLAILTPLAQYPPGPILVLTLFSIFLVVWVFRHTRRTSAEESP